MIKRLYVNNFRCLENFDLALGELPSVLLLGRNGAGKSTIGLALEVLQRIARGTNRVGDLIKPKDLAHGRTDVPARFEVEVTLAGRNYAYSVAFDFPIGFRELRVSEEKLAVDGNPIFTRELAQVRLARTGRDSEAAFRIDWHLVALPIVQEQSRDDPLYIFKKWLGNVLILRPVPSLARGDSEQNSPQTNTPDTHVTNVGAWFFSMVAAAPSTYSQVSEYLAQVMPDFREITNRDLGGETRRLEIHFLKDQRKAALALEDLSDGERCFIVFALTIAANTAYGPILCFWDEPDNFLAPDEVGHSVTALRRAYLNSGQLIVTSHNPEAIRRFSDTNTLYLSRKSHLEPTIVTSVEDMRASGQFEGGFIDALIRGDIEG
jgi:ABC-type cobalamin/Fe3+-siderophores transport system ATPase subunit